MKDWIGKTISKVVITEHIARGGMADVFLGTHTTLNRNVAVKILHAHLADDERLLHRFQTEAQAVASLRHPNIVQVFDCDLSEDQPYIIMELLQGRSLADYLIRLHQTGLTLPLPVIARILSALASALDYAHSQGIVHRDIKPSNIFLREGNTTIQPGMPLPPDTEPILTDFGVAYFAHATTRTASGTILGTPSYMSPEQIRGEAVDARTDIYSLGIMLYEMLTGMLPFNPDTETPASLMYKQVHEPPPPLVHDHEVIQQVVNRALEKSPEDRYQNAGDLARHFREAVQLAMLGVQPQQAQPTRSTTSSEHRPITPKVKLFSSRKRLLISVAAVCGVLLLGAGILYGLSSVRSLLPATSQDSTTEPVDAVIAPTPIAQTDVESTSVPTPLISDTDTTSPAGALRFDAYLVEAVLSNENSPPEGQHYLGYLLDGDGNPTFLGNMQEVEESWTLTFSSDDGSLIESFHRFAITAHAQSDSPVYEPAAELFSAEIPDPTMEALLLLNSIAPDVPIADAVRSGLRSQSGHHDSHLTLTVQSIREGSLDAGKLHAEHVINIIEGTQGDMFGDWDDNQRVDNPGDDFGLLPYTILLQEMLMGSKQWSTDQEELDTIDQLLLQVEEIETSVLVSRKLAQQIALADSIGLIIDLGLAEELASYNLLDSIVTLLSEIEAIELAISVEILNVAP